MSEPEGWEERHFADLGARPMTDAQNNSGVAIEVTPEMIDAGAQVILELDRFYVAWDLAEKVYQAMELERIRSGKRSVGKGSEMPLAPSDAGRKPVRNLLAGDTPEITYPSDLKDNDAVVVVKNTCAVENSYDLAWGPRCLNDPDGLKRPAIINRAAGRDGRGNSV